jgi:hypothetical protein
MHSTAPAKARDEFPLEGPPGLPGFSNRVLGDARAISWNRLRRFLDGEISQTQRLPSSKGPMALPESPSSAIPRTSCFSAWSGVRQCVESVARRAMYSEYQSISSVGCERSQSAAAWALLLAYCLFSDPAGAWLDVGGSEIDRLPRAPVRAVRVVARLDAKVALGESS